MSNTPVMNNTSISTNELETALQSAHPPVVFDVRKRPAFEDDPDMVPGAEWQVHDDVNTWASNLKSGICIIVYCVHGHEVSQNAAQALRLMGFDAKYLEGGFEHWKQASLPVVRSAE